MGLVGIKGFADLPGLHGALGPPVDRGTMARGLHGHSDADGRIGSDVVDSTWHFSTVLGSS